MNADALVASHAACVRCQACKCRHTLEGMLEDLRREKQELQQNFMALKAQALAADNSVADAPEGTPATVMQAEVFVLTHDRQKLQQRLDSMAQHFVTSMTQLKHACMAALGWRCAAVAEALLQWLEYALAAGSVRVSAVNLV